MKTTLIKYCCAFVLLITAFSCSEDDTSPAEEFPNDFAVTQEIFKLVNEYRESNGLSALQKNDTAEQLAIEHTRYMISKSSISHDNFDSRSDKLGEEENSRSSAENVASHYSDAASVMQGWINSDGHRRNIEGNYTHIGIAAVKDENGRYYYTQLFYR